MVSRSLAVEVSRECPRRARVGNLLAGRVVKAWDARVRVWRATENTPLGSWWAEAGRLATGDSVSCSPAGCVRLEVCRVHDGRV